MIPVLFNGDTLLCIAFQPNFGVLMSTKKTAGQLLDANPQELRRILGTAPPGSWIALSEDKTRVVGTGVSVQAAVYQAKLQGESSPVLVQMPTEDEEMAAGAI